MNLANTNVTISPVNKSEYLNTIMIMYIILACFYTLMLTCLCYKNYKPNTNNSFSREKISKILSNIKKLKRVGIEPVLKQS